MFVGLEPFYIRFDDSVLFSRQASFAGEQFEYHHRLLFPFDTHAVYFPRFNVLSGELVGTWT
jgi:hypothetical protein